MSAPYSSEQMTFFTWTVKGQGNLVFEACAGSGKTFSLIHALQFMNGRIFLGVFNKKIAEEIQEKVEENKKKGMVFPGDIKISTMHSAGFSAWKYGGNRSRVDERKCLTILKEMMGVENEEFAYSLNASVIRLVSCAKQAGVGIVCDERDREAWENLYDHFNIEEALPENFSPERAMELAKAVFLKSAESCKQKIDFDDMLWAPLYYNCSFFKHDWVLIDEAQDTNVTRQMIAARSLKKDGRLVAVGDTKQSIFGFTGADSSALKNIEREFRCERLPLSVSWRCGKDIVEYARQWADHINAAPSADKGVVREISEQEFDNVTPEPGDIILCRLNKPIITTAYGLIKRGIRVKVEGRDIGKSLLSLTKKWKVNTLEKLWAKLEEHLEKQTKVLQDKGKERQVQSLADRIGALEVIIEKLLGEDKNTLKDLESEIFKLFEDSKDKSGGKVVRLMTIHKSKGLEAPRVYWYGKNKWNPTPWAKADWEVEQEENLMYVAATRAEKELIIVNV